MTVRRICRAVVHTSKFSFEAYGADEHSALLALRKGLDKHVAQWGVPEPGEWLFDCIRDANTYYVDTGSAYRDGELIR